MFLKASALAELRQRCINVIAEGAGMTHRSVLDKVGGKTQRANDMVHELLKDGVTVSCRGLLYIKGKEAKEPEIPTKPYICCSYGDCTNQVDVNGDACNTHNKEPYARTN